MFCRSCKKKIDDDSLYCKYCGSPQDSSQLKDGLEDKFDPMKEQFVQQFNAKKEERKPMNPMVKKIIIGVAALFVLVIGIISGYKKFHKEKIDIDEFIKINCAGYDGNGVVSYEFDEKKFSKKLKDALGITSNKELEEVFEKSGKKYISLQNCIIDMNESMSFDKDSKLSNGDEIVFTFKYNNDSINKYGIKFTGGKIKYKVKDLEKIREIDPFEGIKIKFYGYSPIVTAQVKNNSKEECLRDIYFKPDKTSFLKEGDVVTVTALKYDEEEFRDAYGVKFTQTEKQYTVENVSKYILSLDEIDDNSLSEVLDKTKEELEEYFKKNKKAFKAKDGINYEGYYFMNVRPDKTEDISVQGDYYGYYYDDCNVFIAVYSATVHDNRKDGYKVEGDDDSEPFDDTKVYFPVLISNIIKYWDGTVFFDYDGMQIMGYTDLGYYIKEQSGPTYDNIEGYKSSKAMKNELIDEEHEYFEYIATGTLADDKE